MAGVFHLGNYLQSVRLLGTRLIGKNASQVTTLFPNSINIAGGYRGTSFFVKHKAEDLWNSMTTVSNPGRKRGRGRGLKKVKNLNIGQTIGVGPSNMIWPGLTTPIIKGKEIIERRQLPPDPEFQAKLNKIRDSTDTRFRVLKLNPLDRGWSGTKMHGRKIGPPDPIGEETFEGFETIVLEFKQVAHMTALYGRKRSISTFVVTGNKNGTVGIALAKSAHGKSAIRKAKNLAGQKLFYIERFDDHTIFHDFYIKIGACKLHVKQQPEGHGLVCHRGIKAVCEMIGIKNIHAKIDARPRKIQNVVKTFLMGLLNQKTHQKIAEDQKLYVVELREENEYCPRIVGSPLVCLKEDELPKSGVPDFYQVVMDGKLPLERKKQPPFYTKLPSWQTYLNKTYKFRNQYNYKVQTVAERGDLTSHTWENKRANDGPPSRPYEGYKHVYKRAVYQIPLNVRKW